MSIYLVQPRICFIGVKFKGQIVVESNHGLVSLEETVTATECVCNDKPVEKLLRCQKQMDRQTDALELCICLRK